MCILHFFRDALDSIDIEVTIEQIKSILNLELSTNKDYSNFATAGVSISNKLQFFLNSSMTYYNADTADLFLFARDNFFNIDIVIFKSNEIEGWAEDLMKNNGCNRNTIHFVKTLSSISLPQCLFPYKIHQWTILQKLSIFYKKLKVMTGYKKLNHAANEEKKIKRMILVFNVSCFHVFFLWQKIVYLEFSLIVNAGRNQSLFCNILVK